MHAVVKVANKAHGWKMTEKLLFDFLKDHLLNYFLTQTRNFSLAHKRWNMMKYCFHHFYSIDKPMVQVVNKTLELLLLFQ